ncbi:hypothetical protein CC77DRAFT_432215 [Alternaria alternata]|uniref:Uncharacterized protein n=1 Tax=Alternaria alternata TaxID=5599 RepID=A0A177D853_ALTAL|nr:hypothetical protein CC77DRAFT_432215 [Alternaria alternata]OAG15706.1 hypothetical protein CC77DRAFT_432215 [Alternaria alternata]
MANPQHTEGQTNSPSECYNNAPYQCSDHNTPVQSPSALNSPNLHQTVPTQHNSPVDHAANLDQTLSNQSRSNQPTTDQLKYGEPLENSFMQNQPVHNSPLQDLPCQSGPNAKQPVIPLQANVPIMKPEKNEMTFNEVMREADEAMQKAKEFMDSTNNTDWKVTEEELEAYEQFEKSLQHDANHVPEVIDQIQAIPNSKYLVHEKYDCVEAEKAAKETHEEVARMLSNLKQPKLRTQESGVAKTSKPAQRVAQSEGDDMQPIPTSKSSSSIHSDKIQNNSQTKESRHRRRRSRLRRQPFDQTVLDNDEDRE